MDRIAADYDRNHSGADVDDSEPVLLTEEERNRLEDRAALELRAGNEELAQRYADALKLDRVHATMIQHFRSKNDLEGTADELRARDIELNQELVNQLRDLLFK